MVQRRGPDAHVRISLRTSTTELSSSLVVTERRRVGSRIARELASEVHVITLSRLSGTIVAINPDLITWIDVTPDTTVSMLGGDKIIVREPLEEVISLVVAFRRAVGDNQRSVSEGTLDYLHRHPDTSGSQRPSARPGTRSSTPPPRTTPPNRT